MGVVGKGHWRAKLKKLLSKANDEDFFQLTWAVDAIQSERESAAKLYLEYPAAAVTTDLTSNFHIHKWELETILNQRLLLPKYRERPGKNRYLNCRNFSAATACVNALRKYENAESGVRLPKIDIFTEIHRIGYRQFSWQRGFFNAPDFYRYAFLYGQGQCKDYFKETYGFAFGDFSLIGFALYAGLRGTPSLPSNYDLAAIGVAPELMAKVIAKLSCDIGEARSEAARINLPNNSIAHQPSLIRQFPIVRFEGSRLRAPLPDLITLRITSGVYYDLVKGGQGLLNEASDRFEQYCFEFFKAMLPTYAPMRAQKTQIGGNSYETPDIRLKAEEEVAIVIECKATKLTFPAQFSDDPMQEAKRVYEELAKGIFQIWRYFSLARRGLIADQIKAHAHAMLLTLDHVLLMSPPMRDQLVAKAKSLVKAEHDITEADMRPVVMCSIDELESVLTSGTSDTFEAALSAMNEPQYEGWMFETVHGAIRGPNKSARPYPFDLDEALPWLREIKATQAKTLASPSEAQPAQ
ncbi:MAG: hypothetical protein J0G33_08135 [Afipia felis]|nr:hypothetical protein [Afipia felis]